MRVGTTIPTGLVLAARAGDRRAVADLVGASLPLVYTIVRQALDNDADADDVVQDVMLRALRQLPTLRKPESFRSWLTAITVNQIGTRLHRRGADAGRAAPLDEAATVADPGADVEGPTVLRLELSAQRRQVVRAGRWLDPDDRVALSLWLLELAGELSRADLAAALGISVAHAGVRIQRMRRQLELSRELDTALHARPRCPRLAAATGGWDGVPSPLWRKRLVRHTRSCDVCQALAPTIVPAERLLPGIVLLPVPLGLTTVLLGKTTTAAPATLAGASGASSVSAGVLGQLAQTAVAHPIAAVVTAGALVAGTAVTVTTLPSAAPPATYAAPRPAATVSLAPGRTVSLESAGNPGSFVTTTGDLGFLTPVSSASSDSTRRRATFTALAGLADPGCFTFRSADGRYLRHASWRFRLDPDQGTPLFRGDATFCVGTGATAGTVTLEASNYPGWFVHHRGGELWVDQTDRSATFLSETSFRLRPPLGR